MLYADGKLTNNKNVQPYEFAWLVVVATPLEPQTVSFGLESFCCGLVSSLVSLLP